MALWVSVCGCENVRACTRTHARSCPPGGRRSSTPPDTLLATTSSLPRTPPIPSLLSHSAPSGALPGAFSSLTRLTLLDLRKNQLQGPLPPSWSTLRQLGELHLGSNDVGPNLPEAWGGAMTNLRVCGCVLCYILFTVYGLVYVSKHSKRWHCHLPMCCSYVWLAMMWGLPCRRHGAV